MSLDAILLLLAALLVIALLVQPAAARLRLPLAAVMLLTGFIGSEVVVRLGYHIALDYAIIHDVVFFGLLPLLVFAAGFRMDTGTLRENLKPVALLALPMPLVTCLLTAALIYWGIGHPQGFPWTSAVVAGAILTATEPFPLRSALGARPGLERVRLLLESEGLINIAIAVVLYDIAVSLAGLPAGSSASPADLVLSFAWSLGGGAVVGIAASLLALWLSRRMPGPEQQALVAVITAYLAFLVGERLLGVSGIVAGLVTGWFFGRATRADFSDEQERFQDSFWAFLSHIAAAIIFLVIGMSFTLPLFEERWLAMLIAVGAVLIVRIAQLQTAALTFRLMPGVTPMNRPETLIGHVAGLRGAVALALALSLPTDLTAWWTIHAMVFGVALFTLVVQAPLAIRLIERMKS